MNDLSPPDASAAALPNAPPPLAEAASPAEPETPAGFSPAGEAAAPVEPLAAGTFARARVRRACGSGARGCARTRFRAQSLRAADRLGDGSMWA